MDLGRRDVRALALGVNSRWIAWLIEAAEEGSLFLDEIGDLPPTIQLKLLRFLESREFYKVGESTPKIADVRIIEGGT